MDRKTILVVDDSAVMRQLIFAVLDAEGYRVLLTADGPAALAHVGQEPIHLILTDWTMIPMDGRELTRQLRLRAECAEVPILVLSTVSSDTSKAEARQAGASGWLCKPIEPATLKAVVGSLLNLARP